MSKTKRVAIKLKPSAEKKVLQNHPWLFDESVVKMPDDARSGDLAIIFSQKTNKLIGIGLVDKDSPICIKMVSFKAEKINSEWLTQRVQKAFEIRKPYLSEQLNSYRLLFGEADGLPGIICDVYDNKAVLKVYSSCWVPYMEWLIEAINQVVNPDCIVLRLSRILQKKSLNFEEGEVLSGELDNEEVEFIEHGVKFSANLIKGHKTGFFLDHRSNRKKIGEMSFGKTVLDVFSYAGGFSIHALTGGAKEVTSVDISEPALELAQRNAELNSYSGSYTQISGDAFKIMDKLHSQNKSFDLVIIDPPSFAKQKTEIVTAIEQYKRLAMLGSELVAKNGMLVLASCSSRITPDLFETICLEELEFSKNVFALKKITGHDFDHPVINEFIEGEYLKCLYFERVS